LLQGGLQGIVVEVVVDVVTPDNSLTRSLTQPSTVASTAVASPVITQPPLASAFWKASPKAASAFPKQVGSTVAAFAIAVSKHTPRLPAFLNAAFNFVTVHFCPGVSLAPATGATARRSRSSGHAPMRRMRLRRQPMGALRVIGTMSSRCWAS
jgi:hypothetical protein